MYIVHVMYVRYHNGSVNFVHYVHAINLHATNPGESFVKWWLLEKPVKKKS